MNYWHDISIGDDAPKTVNVIVEIPKGSQNKYEVDKETGLVSLDRVLFSAVAYPGDYGFIPQTLGEDGDPLDALVLVTQPTYPGVLMTARPLGVLYMNDNGENDEKILCVPTEDPRMKHMTTLDHVAPHTLEEIANFFESYKQLEKKKVTLDGWHDGSDAARIIGDAAARYQEKFSN